MENEKAPVEVFSLSGMLWKLKVALRKRNIIVRNKNNLDAVSPMAVVGEKSERFLQDNFDKYGHKNVCKTISLKKNFAKMISRNPAIYESNFRINPWRENVDLTKVNT